jgi:hypothetical protein
VVIKKERLEEDMKEAKVAFLEKQIDRLKDLVVKLHEELELERAPTYKKILRWFK